MFLPSLRFFCALQNIFNELPENVWTDYFQLAFINELVFDRRFCIFQNVVLFRGMWDQLFIVRTRMYKSIRTHL